MDIKAKPITEQLQAAIFLLKFPLPISRDTHKLHQPKKSDHTAFQRQLATVQARQDDDYIQGGTRGNTKTSQPIVPPEVRQELLDRPQTEPQPRPGVKGNCRNRRKNHTLEKEGLRCCGVS